MPTAMARADGADVLRRADGSRCADVSQAPGRSFARWTFGAKPAWPRPSCNSSARTAGPSKSRSVTTNPAASNAESHPKTGA